jgi:hypothetical protein
MQLDTHIDAIACIRQDECICINLPQPQGRAITPPVIGIGTPVVAG